MQQNYRNNIYLLISLKQVLFDKCTNLGDLTMWFWKKKYFPVGEFLSPGILGHVKNVKNVSRQ